MRIGSVIAALFVGSIFAFSSCEKELYCPKDDCRDTVYITVELPLPEDSLQGGTSEVNPVDINANSTGFDFLGKMQGHWIGANQVMAWEWEWFGFDFRAISESHVFGIFEGGSMGNLLTSFFVSEYKGARTIMARNGGVLSGLYRTSYFVMDSVRSDVNGDFYRFVDAIGGDAVMYMELRFAQDSLYFNAYTSRLGEHAMPTRHMTFRAKKENLHLAQAAQSATGFPANTIERDFSNGFVESNLYVIPGEDSAKSATFLSESTGNEDLFTLGINAGDPYLHSEHPRLSNLQVNIDRNTFIQNDRLFVYLSDESLTDNFGFMQVEPFNTVTLFPELEAGEDDFLFTYLHPGTMYVTVIADRNGDQAPGLGDMTHVSQEITLNPETTEIINITNINVQN